MTSISTNGYVMTKGGLSMHVAIAEKALGKKLPNGAEVHHIDGNKQNNENSNLVVCPTHAYHMLLHRRQRALKETGDASKRLCVYCKAWDFMENLVSRTDNRRGNESRHKSCSAKYVWEKEYGHIGRQTKPYKKRQLGKGPTT